MTILRGKNAIPGQRSAVVEEVAATAQVQYPVIRQGAAIHFQRRDVNRAQRGNADRSAIKF